MKKQVISKVIFIVLIVILIILTIILVKKPKDLTKKMYNKICEDSEYTFSMDELNQEIEYQLEIARIDNNICINVTSNNDKTTTLIKDGYAYYIMHSDKQYYFYNSSDIDADILKNGLSNIQEEKYANGTEKVEEKKYYYEEYEGINAFILLSNFNEQETKLRTRFYYDKGNIVYIKTIINDKDEELLKVKFENKADADVFQIPSDYEEL